MSSRNPILIPTLLLTASMVMSGAGKDKKPKATPLDQYIQEAMSRGAAPSLLPAPGSLWSPSSRLTTLGSDVRAAQVDDIVTVVIAESASAVAQGTTKTQRQSALKSSVSALGGPKAVAGALNNLANASTASQLNGEGATSRSTILNTTLSARVTHVLPNGNLVIEGSKEVTVNSEHQTVTVRGVVRPTDLNTGNTVSSLQVAQMEVNVNGKGVIGDSIRRPFILYRILMGILPF